MRPRRRNTPHLFGLAVAVALTARAEPVVDIWENDGVPFESGQQLVWNYFVGNNSDTQPPDNPYNENISQVFLYDVFSMNQPELSCPTHWSGEATDDDGDLLWQIVFSTTKAPILAGDEKPFVVATYRPDGETPVVAGVRYGQVDFQTVFAQPPAPGDDFIGPMCLKHPFDADADCDIDEHDLEAFEACASGPSIPYQGDCGHFDADADGDIDQSDFGQLQRCFSGEGNLLDCETESP